MKKLSIFTIATFLIVYSVFAQSKKIELETFFNQLAKNNQFNGNVLVAETGKIIYQKSFGFADFSSQKLNNNNLAFPIASITKSFTAVAILQLEERGKLNIDFPVTNYIPEFPYPEIKIKNLLSHTSGLQPYENFLENIRKENPQIVFSNNDVLRKYAELKLPLLYKPGETSSYDNVNYLFLALIIERVSGKSYHQYVKQNIFIPAKMDATFFPEKGFYHLPDFQKEKTVTLYSYPFLYSKELEKAEDNQFISDYWRSYNLQGFGEIFSTTEDLLKYDNALYNGKLLADKSLKKAFSPVLLNDGKPNQGNGNETSFGLGWVLEINEPFGKVVRASGGLVGLRASFLRNISTHQTIILFDNTQNETDRIVKDVFKILNGKNVKPYGKSGAKEYAKFMIKSNQSKLNEFLANTNEYSIDEDEFNNLGYDFMSNNYQTQALATFKLNVQQFPNSWNVYDSYGEALLKYGQKEEAIKMYKKSVELNPNNQYGKKIIEEQTK